MRTKLSRAVRSAICEMYIAAEPTFMARQLQVDVVSSKSSWNRMRSKLE